MYYGYKRGDTYVNLTYRQPLYPIENLALNSGEPEEMEIECFISKEDALYHKEEIRDNFLQFCDAIDECEVIVLADLLFRERYFIPRVIRY